MKILVAEDRPEKCLEIVSFLESISTEISVESAQDLHSAMKSLRDETKDLLILDISMPKRFGDEPRPANGIGFLHDLLNKEQFIAPKHVLGLTEFDAAFEESRSVFELHSWSIIKYSQVEDSWRNKLKIKVEHILRSRNAVVTNLGFDYDVALIFALHEPEMSAWLQSYDCVELQKIPFLAFEALIKVGQSTLRTVACAAPSMGMVPTAVLTCQVLHQFRPKVLAMLGMAAGLNSSSQSYGDVMVAEYSWNYESGRETAVGNEAVSFDADVRQVKTEARVIEEFRKLASDSNCLRRIKESFPISPKNDLKVHYGGICSGSKVVANSNVGKEIKVHVRKAIGLDMEIYGFYHAIDQWPYHKPETFIALKSICDFAGREKDDSYQAYACYTSVKLFQEYLSRIFH